MPLSSLSQKASPNGCTPTNQAPGPLETSRRPQKRRQGEDFDSLMLKMEHMFKEWTRKQDEKNVTILETMQNIKDQISGLSSSIEFISAQYDTIKIKMEHYEEERRKDQTYIQTLKQKIETLERNTRNTSIEVRNVLRTNRETKSDLFTIINNLTDILQVPIKPNEIRNIYRGYAKSEGKNPIVVDLTTTSLKEQLIEAIKSYKKRNKGQNITTSDLKINGPIRQIYISDYLSPTLKRLHYLARDFASSNDYKFCWSTSSAIYLRKKEGDPAIKVRNEEDLNKLTQKL